MRLGKPLKLLAIALITLLVLILAVLLLLATDKLLQVWERVSDLGPWAPAAYAGVLVVISGLMPGCFGESCLALPDQWSLLPPWLTGNPWNSGCSTTWTKACRPGMPVLNWTK